MGQQASQMYISMFALEYIVQGVSNENKEAIIYKLAFIFNKQWILHPWKANITGLNTTTH